MVVELEYKIIKEDDNFIWCETKSGIGFVASKHVYFKTDMSNDNDTSKDQETSSAP